MRGNGVRLFIVVFLVLTAAGCRNPATVEKVFRLQSYASGSGMACFEGRLYLMGDDMSYLLIADTAFHSRDSIQLIDSAKSRIPKNIKPDIEAVSLLRINKTPSLLLLGSGSLDPHRNRGWLISLATKERKLLHLDTFYKRVARSGVKEINVEGATAIPGGILLAHRGNKSSPRNFLIFTSYGFWDSQTTADIRLMKLGANTDTASFSGVSGLEYSSKSDCLLLTVSTENTYSTRSDGAIGKSYLWLINNFSSKRRWTAINPDRIIDLEEMDARLKGNKIESVCIVSESKSEYELVVVADNDNGTSILFKIKLRKKS